MRILRQPPRPVLKWVGGKRKLLPKLLPMLPEGVKGMRYVEPFVGGGAMYFALRPKRALLGDLNSDLIGVYGSVGSDLDEVMHHLTRLQRLHCKDPEGTYYQARELFNNERDLGTVKRASLFLYLNRTCFNGVYRVNKKGDFNVSMGRYTNPTILDEPALRAAHRLLQHAAMECQHFDGTLEDVGKGDFVYLDPPYEPVSKTSNFTAFTKEGFTHQDQVQLFTAFGRLTRRGAKAMMSNSDSALVRRLYAGYDMVEVKAPRAVNSKASARGEVTELVIRNYP